MFCFLIILIQRTANNTFQGKRKQENERKEDKVMLKRFENDYTHFLWDKKKLHTINTFHSMTSDGLKEYFLTRRVKTDTFNGTIIYHYTDYGKTLRSKVFQVYTHTAPYTVSSLDNVYWKNGTVDREYKRV